MKILFRLCFFVFLPIIIVVGLTLIFTGVDTRGMVLAIGIPGILVGYFIIWFIAPDKKNTQTNQGEQSEQEQEQAVLSDLQEPANNESSAEEWRTKEQELASLNAINSSKFHMSKIELADYEARHVKEVMRHASPKGIALGIIFFLLLIVDAVLATVFVIKQIFVGGIVCAVIFGVVVITLLIMAFTREKIAMNGDISKAKKIISGEIKACFISSMLKMESDPTVRVSGAVYRIIISAEGCEYVAYSKQFYENGEPVVIAVMGKKRAKIVDADAPENVTIK